MAFRVGILYLSLVAQVLLSFMSQTEEAFFQQNFDKYTEWGTI